MDESLSLSKFFSSLTNLFIRLIPMRGRPVASDCEQPATVLLVVKNSEKCTAGATLASTFIKLLTGHEVVDISATYAGSMETPSIRDAQRPYRFDYVIAITTEMYVGEVWIKVEVNAPDGSTKSERFSRPCNLSNYELGLIQFRVLPWLAQTQGLVPLSTSRS